MNSLSAHARCPALLGLAALLLIGSRLIACGGEKSPTEPEGPARTYRMGFSGIPARADFDLLLAAIDVWSLRADAAILSYETPWDSLLAGVPVEDLVQRHQVGLAEYYRAKGLQIWVYLDPGNGLNRAGWETRPAWASTRTSPTSPSSTSWGCPPTRIMRASTPPRRFPTATTPASSPGTTSRWQ